MDSIQTGQLIRKLRTEHGWTQKELADALMISDRTVSKWERGRGYPDVSLVTQLSQLFQVETNQLLAGALTQNKMNNGNIKQVRFFVCPTCQTINFSFGKTEMICCGRHLEPLIPQTEQKEHIVKIEDIEADRYATFTHEMTKEHSLSFLALVSGDQIQLKKLYPEQEPAVRLPRMCHATLYFYCTKHGLFKKEQANGHFF